MALPGLDHALVGSTFKHMQVQEVPCMALQAKSTVNRVHVLLG